MGRSRLEIIRDILSLCQKPTQLHRIMYDCNLGYNIMHKYVKELISKGFLKVQVDSSRRYVTTEKGKILMDTITQATSLLS